MASFIEEAFTYAHQHMKFENAQLYSDWMLDKIITARAKEFIYLYIQQKFFEYDLPLSWITFTECLNINQADTQWLGKFFTKQNFILLKSLNDGKPATDRTAIDIFLGISK